MILSSLLVLSALIILARLLVGMAIYALPVACGAGAAFASYAAGAGLIGSLALGFIAGTAALVIIQILVTVPRSPMIRVIVGLTIATPSAALGYGLSYGLLAATGTHGAWLVALSLIGALGIGFVALQRIAFAPPGGAGRAVGSTNAVAGAHIRSA